MKIKNLFVMALMAAATVTTFSGCGGSGDNGSGDGYISAKKFANGGSVIRTQNTRSLEIAPYQKIAGGTSSVVRVPGEQAGDPDIIYEVTDSVRCRGTIGVVGGSTYSAEFTYSLTTDNCGVIDVTITSSQSTDDSLFLAALGFGVSDISDDSSSSTSGSTYERMTVNWIDDLTLQIVLNFSTSYMNIITSGAGYKITYYDSVGNETSQRASTTPIRVQTVPLPYYIQAN